MLLKRPGFFIYIFIFYVFTTNKVSLYWTNGVFSEINFINILRAPIFAQNVLDSFSLLYLLYFLIFCQKNIDKKAACKMLVKLTTVVNFINVKCINFLYKHRFGSFFYIHTTRKKRPKWRSYEKRVRLTLMKLTTGVVDVTNEIFG